MANTFEISVNLNGLPKVLDKYKTRVPRKALLCGRAGALVAGRMIKSSIKKYVPTLKRKNIMKNDGWELMRSKGEAKKTVYFTFSKKHSDWSEGYLRYVVGMGHGSGKGGEYNNGWFMPFLEFGHAFVNTISKPHKGKGPYAHPRDNKAAVAAGYTPQSVRKRIRKNRELYNRIIQEVRYVAPVNGGQGFMMPGFMAVKSAADAAAKQAAEKEAAKQFKGLT